jgi:hypothetical protein
MMSNPSARTRRIAAALYTMMLLTLPRSTLAQPVVREVLDYVDVERSDRAVAIRVYFRFPVNYVRHFPFESGDTLLIHVTPTIFEERQKDTPGREVLRPPDDPDVPLTDIVYDTRTLWSPYLMLHFSRRVDFRVRQGSDFRSIIVELPLPPQPNPSPSPSNHEEHGAP